MTKKTGPFLKALIISLIMLSPFALICSVSFAGPIVIDHTCADLSHVPSDWIDQAKAMFRISYGHTSHGSQIVTGMDLLKGAPGSLYWFDHNGTNGGLSLHDHEPSGDLGHNGSLVWEQSTRALLGTPGCDRNMIIWSWCGGVSDNTEEGINIYLNAMNQLELDYPHVTFVYMTGHLDGTGEDGNLNIRNNQIRDYCTANNKVLFDFADIERYDPDGADYLDLGANDNCNYNGGNWADEWCAANPDSDLCASCSCAHSKPLNCNLKGRAFWWMMARLAGWNPGTSRNVLTVTIPESASEGDGVLTGQGMVSIPETLESNLAVFLASGDITELTVPSTVTINAGNTSATFDLTIVDDTEIDGTQSVTVTASADGRTIGADTIAVVDNDDTGGGGGCFIATAAYGSRMEPHLKVLCEFRDRFLLTNAAGKFFVDIYYTYSPRVADLITRNDMLQAPVRWALLPLVAMTYVTLHFGPAPALVFMFVLFALMIATGVLAIRRRPRVIENGKSRGDLIDRLRD